MEQQPLAHSGASLEARCHSYHSCHDKAAEAESTLCSLPCGPELAVGHRDSRR